MWVAVAAIVLFCLFPFYWLVNISLKTGNDLLGNVYGAQKVDTLPHVPTNSFNGLSDVAPSTFWSPYPTN